MNKSLFSIFNMQFNLPRLPQLLLLSVTFILTLIFVLELALPVRPEQNNSNNHFQSLRKQFSNISDLSQPNAVKFTQLDRVLKPGLFKASSQFLDRPMAQKTIRNIKSKLKLQCIMKIGGVTVAYINIKGIGLKRCRVGDKVHDLFTLLEIRKSSVVIMIIGHKVTLSI